MGMIDFYGFKMDLHYYHLKMLNGKYQVFLRKEIINPTVIIPIGDLMDNEEQAQSIIKTLAEALDHKVEHEESR
jgi:hypothetical protein